MITHAKDPQIKSPRDLNYVNLREMIRKLGSKRVTDQLLKELKDGTIAPQAFAPNLLARAYMPDHFGRIELGESHLILKEESIDSSQFATINAAVLSSLVMQGYAAVDQGVFESLCTVVPSKLKREFIPGISPPTDDAFIVTEGTEFPMSNINEDYVETNPTEQFGNRIELTYSAVFFDRTALLAKQAQLIGEGLARFRLKALLRFVLGIHTASTTKFAFKWKGTAYDIFQASTPWVNVKTSNALVDWTDIDAALQAAAVNSDPNTGAPIQMVPTTLLVPPALGYTAKRIVQATEVRHNDGASNTPVTVGPNMIQDLNLTVVMSEFAKRLLDDEGGLTSAQADGTWFIGDPKKAFAWIQNWPYRSLQLADGSDKKFTHDTWFGYRADERGGGACLDPRYWIKCSAP